MRAFKWQSTNDSLQSPVFKSQFLSDSFLVTIVYSNKWQSTIDCLHSTSDSSLQVTAVYKLQSINDSRRYEGYWDA